MDELYTVVKHDYNQYEDKPTQRNVTQLRKSLLLLKKMCDEERKRVLKVHKDLKAKKQTKLSEEKKSNE